MNLEKSTGIEIYLVAEDESNLAEIEIHDDFMTMVEYLSLLTPQENMSTKVYHGILMPASILPSKIDEGISCFVIALEMTYKKHVSVLQGCIYESDCEGDIDLLAKDIEDMVTDNTYAVGMRPTIDDVFVLYGYELELCLSVNADSVRNDGIVEKCEDIAEELKQIKASCEGD